MVHRLDLDRRVRNDWTRPVFCGQRHRHGRSIAFQMAEVMVPRALFQQILAAISALRPSPPPDRC
jgi:hypothetical protein